MRHFISNSAALTALLLTINTGWAQSDQSPQPNPDPETNQAIDQETNVQQSNNTSWQVSPNAEPSISQLPVTDGQIYLLRHDASGREYICVNGCRVYFDAVSSMTTVESQPQQRYESAFGNQDADTAEANQEDGSESTDSSNQTAQQPTSDETEHTAANTQEEADRSNDRSSDAVDSLPQDEVPQQEAAAPVDPTPTEPAEQDAQGEGAVTEPESQANAKSNSDA